ncbi:MAG: hypothetical protein WAS72_13425, partial [Saprospiraceae bacterium]
MAVLLTVILLSCSKEQEIGDNAVKDNSLIIKSKLKRIEYALKKPDDLSRSENMSPEEAVWGIEAMMNIYFSRQEKCEDFKNFTETLSIPISGDVVTTSVFNTAYNTAWQKLVLHYNSISWTQKQVLSINTKVISQTSDAISYTFDIRIGKSTNASFSPIECDLNVFTAEDNWNAGLLAGDGKCDGSITTSDAAEEMEKKMNIYYPLYHRPVSPSSGAPLLAGFLDLYTLNTQYSDDFENNDDQIPNDNIRDRLLCFTKSSAPNYFFPDCVEEPDMEWYFCNLVNIIPTQLPTDKAFVSIDINADGIACTDCPTNRLHSFKIQCGTPFFVSDINWWPPNWGSIN